MTKQYYYVVTVTRTDYEKLVDEIFNFEYEADAGEDIPDACREALKIAYHGCADND